MKVVITAAARSDLIGIGDFMSYAIYYFATSLESEFYQRLCQDKATYILTAMSFQRRFDWLDREPEEVEEMLEPLIEDYPDTFPTQDEALPIIERFETYMQTCPLEYVMLPSYECRGIEAALNHFLATSQRDETELISNLLYASDARNSFQKFNPHLLPAAVIGNLNDLILSSSQLIQIGANLLRNIPPELIFDDVPEPWQDSNRGNRWDNETALLFGYWRDLHLAAADRQDAMLIGIA